MIKRFLDGRGVKMSINKNELTKELIQKAMACKTAEELMATAKAMGYERRSRGIFGGDGRL